MLLAAALLPTPYHLVSCLYSTSFFRSILYSISSVVVVFFSSPSHNFNYVDWMTRQKRKETRTKKEERRRSNGWCSCITLLYHIYTAWYLYTITNYYPPTRSITNSPCMGLWRSLFALSFGIYLIAVCLCVCLSVCVCNAKTIHTRVGWHAPCYILYDVREKTLS